MSKYLDNFSVIVKVSRRFVCDFRSFSIVCERLSKFLNGVSIKDRKKLSTVCKIFSKFVFEL